MGSSKYILSCCVGEEQKPSDKCCDNCHESDRLKSYSMIMNDEVVEFRHCCKFSVKIRTSGNLSFVLDFNDKGEM